jgi:HSP20 family protein
MITSSKMAIATAFLTGLLAMTASTDAYRITYRPVFQTRAVRRTSPFALSRQSFFPSDIGRSRMMEDVDELFDSMLGDVNDMYFDSSPFQRRSRPSYLLEGRPSAALVPKRTANTYSITQDEKQVKMVVTVPGAKASDVKLDLDEDNRTLRISGETQFENEGLSVHSKFDKSFTLDRNLDISGVAAEFDNGVLTITAPKFEEIKDSVRRIDVVDNSSSEEEVNEVAQTEENEEHDDTVAVVDTEVKAEAETSEQRNEQEVEPEHKADESVIDLDDKDIP